MLRDHILDNPESVADLEAHTTNLQGVNFTVKDPNKLLAAIRAAKTGTDKAFKEGSTKPSDWKAHWAMSTSFLATNGIGFREPWRYYLNDRAVQLHNARLPGLNDNLKLDNGIAQRFGNGNSLDLSALHISVAFGHKRTRCNIHIDKTGIAMADMDDNNVSITPDSIPHLFNDLILKTYAAEVLPHWFVDRVNLHLFSPSMGYGRAGVSADLIKRESFKVTIAASCGLRSCTNISFSKVLGLDTKGMLELNAGEAVKVLKSINPTISISGKF